MVKVGSHCGVRIWTGIQETDHLFVALFVHNVKRPNHLGSENNSAINSMSLRITLSLSISKDSYL